MQLLPDTQRLAPFLRGFIPLWRNSPTRLRQDESHVKKNECRKPLDISNLSPYDYRPAMLWGKKGDRRSGLSSYGSSGDLSRRKDPARPGMGQKEGSGQLALRVRPDSGPAAGIPDGSVDGKEAVRGCGRSKETIPRPGESPPGRKNLARAADRGDCRNANRMS